MGLGYVFAQESLGRIAGRGAGWAGFWIATAGSVMAAVTILRGQSTVLYTFYPPMQAHPLFYIGATLLVVGSWIWGGVMIASYRAWCAEHPGVAAPLSIHGMKIAAVVLIVLGVISLAYGGISYTREKKVVDLGPLQASTKTRETIPLPPVLGAAAIAGGIVLLVVSSRKR